MTDVMHVADGTAERDSQQQSIDLQEPPVKQESAQPQQPLQQQQQQQQPQSEPQPQPQGEEAKEAVHAPPLSPYTQPAHGAFHPSDGGGYLPGVSELETYQPSRPWNNRMVMEGPMLGYGYSERSVPGPADAPWYGNWQPAPGPVAAHRRVSAPSGHHFSPNYSYGPAYPHPGGPREPGSDTAAPHAAPYGNRRHSAARYPMDGPYIPSPTDSNPPLSPPHPVPPPYPGPYAAYPPHYLPRQSGPYAPNPAPHPHHPHSPPYPHDLHPHPAPPQQPEPRHHPSQPQAQPQPQQPRPPRPANAFMLYRRDHQRQIRTQNPRLTNNEVSTVVGEMWRNEKEEIKDEYRQRAAQGRVLHYAMYPDYQYTVKSGKRKKKESVADVNASGGGKVKERRGSIGA